MVARYLAGDPIAELPVWHISADHRRIGSPHRSRHALLAPPHLPAQDAGTTA
jgi:hypothetical protein